jgi:lysozyme family protein
MLGGSDGHNGLNELFALRSPQLKLYDSVVLVRQANLKQHETAVHFSVKRSKTGLRGLTVVP